MGFTRTALSYESAYATRLPLRAFPLVPFVASLNLVSISKRIGGSKRMVKGIDDSCLVSDLRLVLEPAL